MRTKIIFTLIALLIASTVGAQTVVNPHNVEFIASADHNVVVSGIPMVDHYDLNVMVGNATGALSFTQGLGKPSPDAVSLIKVAVPRFDTLPRGTYVVTVAAVSLSGAIGLSDPSLPFVETGIPAKPGIPIVSK